MIGTSTTCTDSTGANGETIRSCKSNGSGYDGATYTLKFTIETVQYNRYQDAWNVDVAIAEEKPHPATKFLAESATNPRTITSYNDTNADKGKMFYFTHTLNEGTENEKTITETRYIGNEPKNYVYFNCADPVDGQEYNYATSCEVWRILGVFDVEKEIDDSEHAGQKITVIEQRMKLVRGLALESREVNLPSNNDWTNTSLNAYLNTDYYNSLQASAKGMIDEAKYYLGSVSLDTSNKYGTTEKIYGEERGTTVCGACGTNDIKLTWQGNVGLMYPSDAFMVYKGIDENCYNNPYNCYSNGIPTKSWIYNSNHEKGKSVRNTWLMSSKVGSSSILLLLLLVDSFGNLRDNVSYLTLYVRPVVYLSSSVQIFDDGSEGNSYKLKK